MKASLSLRITKTQDERLGAIANTLGLGRYQTAIRALETGLASLLAPTDLKGRPPVDDGLSEAVGELLARAERTEKLVDRVLYVAAADFVFTRRTTLKGERDAAEVDKVLTDAAGEAYRRQRDLARSGHHD